MRFYVGYLRVDPTEVGTVLHMVASNGDGEALQLFADVVHEMWWIVLKFKMEPYPHGYT